MTGSYIYVGGKRPRAEGRGRAGSLEMKHKRFFLQAPSLLLPVFFRQGLLCVPPPPLPFPLDVSQTGWRRRLLGPFPFPFPLSLSLLTFVPRGGWEDGWIFGVGSFGTLSLPPPLTHHGPSLNLGTNEERGDEKEDD